MNAQTAKVQNTLHSEDDANESGSEYVPSDEYDSEEESTKQSEKKRKTIKCKENITRFKRGNSMNKANVMF